MSVCAVGDLFIGTANLLGELTQQINSTFQLNSILTHKRFELKYIHDWGLSET